MNTDSSSDQYTTSETSTSDSSDDERLETVQACGVRLQIPQGLCEQKEVFDEFFSSHAWNSLSDNSRQRLAQLLPTFPEDDEHEKFVTLQRLFRGDVFKFTNPLSQFHKKLKAGHFRPEVAKMRYMIRKAERKEAKQRYRQYREHLQSEVLESRRNLLNAVSGIRLRVEQSNTNVASFASPISYRTKVRYFQELATIKSKVNESGFSSDDNYPEGPPSPISRKQKRHLNTLRGSLQTKLVISTMASKSNSLDLERHITSHHNPFLITDDSYRTLLLGHKRQRLLDPDNFEFNTKTVTINDVINRTKLTYVKKSPPVNSVKRRVERKIKSRKKLKRNLQPQPPQPPPNITHSPELLTQSNPFFGLSSQSELESDSDSLIDSVLQTNMFGKRKKLKSESKQENHFKALSVVTESPEKASSPISSNSLKSPYNFGKITPATFSDLDGIDMMNLPIDLEDDCIDLLETSRQELMQKTHTNFFSVIRDLICSTSEHRMDFNTLEDRLKLWQENPISTLNDWYSSADNWLILLKSAVDFLSGNMSEQPLEFVPYLEYKQQLGVYQWIGAGRDSDQSLSSLAKYWLDHRNEAKDFKEEKDIEVEVIDRSQTPPPPRCPTNWSVRRADLDEIQIYREQERRRYDNPHKAFTFRCNGYESVVGPLKGIYNAGPGSAKARGHTMLSADRPNFVTILSLVRDATARLPNGEGTRADICELLKSSQYISPTAPDNVLQSVVSGALDRMHTQFDPCVKYDPKRKIWIYLHRNRSEEDFERLHQQYQNMGKTPKKINKTKTSKPKSKERKSKESPPPILEKLKVKPKVNSNQNSPTTDITTIQPGTSLLLPHVSKLVKLEQNEIRSPSPKITRQEEKEINDALQSIMQKSSSPKPKSLVKIISPSQKSLTLPSTSKVEQKPTPKPQTNVQLLHTSQKQNTIKIEVADKVESSTKQVQVQSNKVPISIQQQILQTISPQQLQNIKNVALIRNVTQKQNTSQPQTISISSNAMGNQVPITVTRNAETGVQQIRVQQTALTPTQQQQILQSLKHKAVPVQASVLGGQQQVFVKQKSGVSQIQKTAQPTGTTSMLGQARLSNETVTSKPIINTNQTPLVAKVLTNAAGQVISLESLLAHQKQHGSLPQGTTLRVSGVKGAQTNIIQLAAPTKQSSVTQLAVGSQNNLIAIANQPKLVFSTHVVTSTTTVTTAAKNATRNMKAQTVTKFTPKIAQQLINAKFITQNVDNAKLVQNKVIIGQNQVKTNKVVANKSVPVAGNSNTIRMVSAANLNLTHFGVKPVLLASKGGTLQNLGGQNVLIQSQANSQGLMTLSTSKPITVSSHSATGNVNLQQNAQYVLAPQLKVQQSQQVLLSSNLKTSNIQQNQGGNQSQLILGGQPVRLQGTTSSGSQRVVLASQGQGGQIVAQQILLPAGFQGTAINIKALQGVKVIPIAQAQQNKGVQNRQVFTRVMNTPNIVRTVQHTSQDDTGAPTGE